MWWSLETGSALQTGYGWQIDVSMPELATLRILHRHRERILARCRAAVAFHPQWAGTRYIERKTKANAKPHDKLTRARKHSAVSC